MAYLRLAENSKYSFLLESVVGGENVSRYSFIGAGEMASFGRWVPCWPGYSLRSSESHQNRTQRRDQWWPDDRFAERTCSTSIHQDTRSTNIFWGAIGYVAYDCIQHFEPKTKAELRDPLGIPEAVFMLVDTLLIYDHIFQTLKVVSHVFSPMDSPQENLSFIYQTAVAKVRRLARILLTSSTPEPYQPPITLGNEGVSNVGKVGYEGFVTKLKQHIVAGDIIQAVPSQRLARKTDLHPFNAYRHLRQLNPSPYMFFLDFGEFQLVGASPETLCKVEKNVVFNHAIAGTTKRGKTPEGVSRWYRIEIVQILPPIHRGWEARCYPSGLGEG